MNSHVLPLLLLCSIHSAHRHAHTNYNIKEHASSNDVCWNWVIDLLGKCSPMCLKLWYHVSYKDLHKCKEVTNLHKVFESCINWLRILNMHGIGALRCNKLLVGWQFKYIHVWYVKITAHQIKACRGCRSWDSVYNDGKSIRRVWILHTLECEGFLSDRRGGNWSVALQQVDICWPSHIKGALWNFLFLHSHHNALCISLRSEKHADFIPHETFVKQEWAQYKRNWDPLVKTLLY